MSTKVVSYSIWGDGYLYCAGLLENLRIAPTIYSGWESWVYHDASVPGSVLAEARELGAHTIAVEKPRGRWDGLFWRFLPAAHPQVERFVVRDTDSRITSRGKAAVDDWIASGRLVHCMRDNIHHNVPIMGGMWGAASGVLRDIKSLISGWGRYDKKGEDQLFLSELIWPRVRRLALVHDRYHDGVIRTPDGRIIPFTDLREYNPWDNCGDEKLEEFPKGRIVLDTGETFQRLDCYVYLPREMFGEHEVRPFPPHPPIEFGSYVGEDIKVNQ